VVKDGLLTKVDNFKFVNPAKSLSGYKSEMSLSQVVTFFERQGIIFTKTMIQHYMKSGFLPPLINKRYYNKRHIYMLSIIHILKDIYSLDDIKTIFSDLLSGENFEAVYDTFISLYEEAISGWKADLPEAVKNLTASEFDSENTVESAKRQDTVLASLLMAHSAAAKELAKLAIGK
jgi:DNA-binding transcriptional MerR regulator